MTGTWISYNMATGKHSHIALYSVILIYVGYTVNKRMSIKEIDKSFICDNILTYER